MYAKPFINKTAPKIKPMIITRILIILMISFRALTASAQDSTWIRSYSITGFNQLDLRNSSWNSIAIHRGVHDIFRNSIKKRLPTKLGNITYSIFSFSSTYLSMIWSHETGHVLRARQVGGEFRIHNGQLPIPYTTMHLPMNITLFDEALSVTGGFEVNSLNVRHLQRTFMEQNGNYNEDLSYSFANRLMYPIYTTLVVPIDPEDRDVWIHTAGDPVHCILPVFKAYSGGAVILPDGTVNPDLVRFYNHSAILGTFFNLLDPQFYREAGAAFGRSSKKRQPVFMVGNHRNGWTYGTQFNTSPLGYELYLTNYIHVLDHQYSLYFKYGNPFKNNGLGARWSNILRNERVQIAANLEVWDQAIFGKGISAEVESKLRLNDFFSLDLFTGYKAKGYVMGKQLSAGPNLGLGLTYYGNY